MYTRAHGCNFRFRNNDISSLRRRVYNNITLLPVTTYPVCPLRFYSLDSYVNVPFLRNFVYRVRPCGIVQRKVHFLLRFNCHVLGLFRKRSLIIFYFILPELVVYANRFFVDHNHTFEYYPTFDKKLKISRVDPINSAPSIGYGPGHVNLTDFKCV